MPNQTAWEWSTAAAMQSYVAGTIAREDYLRDRRELVAQVRGALAPDPAARLFEIGSGEGVMARDLAADVGELYCLDVSGSFLDVARRTCAGRPNVAFQKIDENYLDVLPDDAFDGGYCLNVFIHLGVYEIHQYLLGVARVLHGGGRFIFNFATLGPATIGLFRSYAARFRDASPMQLPGFMRWHGREVVETLATEAGLVPEPASFVDRGGICTLVVRRDGARA